MPEARHCTMFFLRKLMNGEKKFFYTKDVHMVSVPRFASISVKFVLAEIWNREEIRIYLPDMKNINSKSIDRQFLFNIVNTVDPQFFRDEVERAE